MDSLISIIMPAYNAETTIKESIDSVLAQTYKSWELIIVNDSSSDNTELLIDLYIHKDSRIKKINTLENKGVSDSTNVAIDLCLGNYIAFLDSDDVWLTSKLESQLKYLKKGHDIVCSNYIIFSDSDDTNNKITNAPEIITYPMMLKSNFIGNLTGIYNADKLGKEFQKNKGHEDYIMWLSLLKRTNNAYCIKKPLAKYRASSQSLSGNKLKAMKWQWSIYRNELKLSLPKSIYYFSHYIFNALKKRR